MTPISRIDQERGRTLRPYAIWKDMFFAAFIILAIAACAYYFGPFGPTGQPDPTIIQTAPKPDYFSCGFTLCFHFFRHRLKHRSFSSSHLSNYWLDPSAFLSGEGEKELEAQTYCSHHRAHDRDRARHVYSSGPVHALESAHERLERRSVPERYIHGTTALERQGALVFQVKQCRNCHSLVIRVDKGDQPWIASRCGSHTTSSSGR